MEEAERLLLSTERAMKKVIISSIPPSSTPEVISAIDFVVATLASYLLEEGEDDFDLDLTALLLDAGLKNDEDDADNAFTALLETLNIMLDPNSLGSEFEETEDYSHCSMCERHTKLTLHHLIPKQTFPHYLKKKLLPPNITIPNFSKTFKIGQFLNSYGIYVCRPCHSAIHRCETNKVLATEFNNLERLMEHPKIGGWVAFNAKQKVKGEKRI
ncbi:hypothetical protein TL16_g07792 [Triparma laevis f. inornata]|uniref:Uncharacterized protein n=1 Tax=Triparma laevis f. inornata TaxID=1714386 RepID=A0A9W7B2K5_9STRA|nr:hypothetical protein TL16_g07792 [Triparma laevis f. inornata]